MANLFDQFDSVQANPFDQFDQQPGILDSLIGGGEQALKVGSEFAAPVVGAIPAALKTLNQSSDESSSKDSEGRSGFAKVYSDIIDRLTYEPKTEKGKDYNSAVDEFINRNIMPLVGHGPVIEGASTARTIQGDLKKMASDPRVDRLLKKQAEIDAAKTAPAVNPFDQFDKAAMGDESGQMGLFDQSEVGNTGRSPYGDLKGEWRTDENGMPVRADLSMEAANLENPLQRNLHGDELGPGLEQGRSMTEAMDDTKAAAEGATDLPTAVGQRDLFHEQVSLLRDELPASNELKTAKMEADGNLLPFDETNKFQPTNPLPTKTLGELQKEGARPAPGIPGGARGRQTGAIDPRVFKEGFQKLKQLADGTWLRAYADGRGLTVEAVKDSHVVGEATFDKPRFDTDNLKSNYTASQRRGLGKEMYKFVSELGNDIERSPTQTDAGKAMWSKFEQTGLAKDGVIPRKVDPTNPPSMSPLGKGKRGQGGAILFENKAKEQVEKVIGKQEDAPLFPDDPKWAEVKDDALGEGKDSRQWNYTESGGTLSAMKRASAAVQAASRLIQNALKRADLAIRKNVFPVEQALRGLSRDEVKSLGEVMKEEMFREKRFDGEALLEAGFSTKQLLAYDKMRDMFEDTLRIQNEARAAEGKKPITASEAYLSSRWKGDFRRPIYNTDGKLVWYLAADTKMGLEHQSAALLKEFPDLVADPKKDHVIRYYKRQTDLQSVYSTILDILGRDDPAVERIQSYLKDQTANEAASFLNQEKHFKDKGNIRGFIGDRPGKKGSLSESLAMFQQQIQYAKNAYKWSELQKAGQGIKEIITDPDLREQQPNNVKYIREYFKNAIGYGEARAISHLEDAVRELGLSPTLADSAIGGMKTYFILNKLAISAGFTITQGLQYANSFSHIADLWSKGYHGNPVTAVAMGISSGIVMAAKHYANFLGGKSTDLFQGIGHDHFINRAFKYAEDNGVTARSIYDESPVEAAFNPVGRVANVAGKTLSISETFLRSATYMTFVQMLKDSGKFTKDIDIFQMAEERTNAAMVDYRAQERPMAFAKLGAIGNALNTLQTYPMNWYNQWNYFGRELAKGNVAPFMAAFATQYALAGAMGIPGFADVDKLYDFIKGHLPTKYWVKAQESDFWQDPKVWMIKNFGQPSVYGYLSDKTGLGLTNRITAPAGNEMIQAPGGPLVDIAKQIYHVGDAALHPTDTTKRAQAVQAVTPPGLYGAVETSPQMEGITYEKRQMPDGSHKYVVQAQSDLAGHVGTYVRDQHEQDLRKYGLRSQDEVVGKELGYRMHNDYEVQAPQRANALVKDFYDAVVKRGDAEKAKELQQLHVKLTGQEINVGAIEKQALDNYTTTLERASMSQKLSAIQGYARTQKILEDIKAGK